MWRCSKKIFLLCFSLSISILLNGQTVASSSDYPQFFCFENAEAGTDWSTFSRNGDGGKWYAGDKFSMLKPHALYLSADNSQTPSFVGTRNGYVSSIAKEFDFQAGRYRLKFDYLLDYVVGQPPVDMKIAIVPSQTLNVYMSSSVGEYPSAAQTNPFVDDDGDNLFGYAKWRSVEGDFIITDDGSYRIAFFFRSAENGLQQSGHCSVDNIQIDFIDDSYVAEPQNVTAAINDSDLRISWQSQAQSFDLLFYALSQTSGNDYQHYENIESNSFSISCADLDEGYYYVRVRAKGANGRYSLYTKPVGVLYFDKSKHCINYIDLEASSVTCASGSFEEPSALIGVIDNGYDNVNSYHTVHYLPNEYDARTGYMLKTVPDGSAASVRLSSWKEYDSPSGSITYDYFVEQGAEILFLKFAAVLEYYHSHSAQEQTSIKVRILDENGNELDHQCAFVDFNAADVAAGKLRGWNTYTPTAGDGIALTDCVVKWLDWRELSINLIPYCGQKVKIEISVSACSANMHFGYAYFALDCVSAQLGGVECGERASEIIAPQGFDYKWYRKGDETKTTLSTERIFSLNETEQSDFCVDLLSKENKNCVITLTAFTVPRSISIEPITHWNPHDCTNEMELNMNSVITINGQIDNSTKPEAVYWDLGEYGTFFGEQVSFEFPLQGDTIEASVRALLAGCEAVSTLTIECPSIEVKGFGMKHSFVCEGDSVEVFGQYYKRPGSHSIHTTSRYGCDSLIAFHLEVLSPTKIEKGVVKICRNNLPYDFFGEPIYTEGNHYVYVKSKRGDCDTLIYHGYFLFTDGMETSLNTDAEQMLFCGNDDGFEISYSVEQGQVHQYSLAWDEVSKQAGFKDVTYPVTDDNIIKISFPENLKPDYYHAVLSFINSSCGHQDYDINFVVRYPAEVIKQLWNDVLAIKNSQFNGGYDFSSVEWRCGDEKLQSHKEAQSQYYTENAELKFGKPYYALLTRQDEDYAVPTCYFYPQKIDKENITLVTNLLFKEELLDIRSDVAARAEVFDVEGRRVASYELNEGQNLFAVPQKGGVYMLKITLLSGEIRTFKFIVRP